jgi:hypothetical protein
MATGWTECLALPNKTQWAVHEAIQEMRKRLPFPLLGTTGTLEKNQQVDLYEFAMKLERQADLNPMLDILKSTPIKG